MSPLRAMLLFPARPAAAARALRGRRAAGLAVLLPALAFGAYLVARAAAPGDALVAAGALLLVEVGLGLGGALGCGAAGLILGRAVEVRSHLAPCLVFAAWTVVLFPVLLALLAVLGAGDLAGLAAGLLLLTWGVVAGRGVLGDEREAGRGLVAACAALSAALLGLWVAGWAATLMVWPWRAPVTVEGAHAGDLLLVVRDRSPEAADLLLARNAAGAVVLARRGPDGRLAPVGQQPVARGPWTPHGRVFFRFGGAWGGCVLRGQQPGAKPPSSRRM